MDPLSFGLSAADSALSFGSTMLQNHYNKELVEYQNDKNLEFWHKQNEYNSPSATMNRLVDAGINPRAYQQIGQFANAGSPQPVAVPNKVSELSAFQSVVRQGLENELLSIEVEQKSMDALLKQKLFTKAHYDAANSNVKALVASLVNGLIPEDIYGLGPASTYKDSALYNYIQKGTTLHPYLRKGELRNLLDAAGVDLRKFESAMKEIEFLDYQNYGIRGNSDYINAGRAIINLLKDFLK